LKSNKTIDRNKTVNSSINDKAIIIYFGYTAPHINGSIIDSFEYYYTLWEQDKTVQYIFVDASSNNIEFIHDFLKKRYIIDSDCLQNIISVKTTKLILHKFKKILITDSTTVNMMKNNLPIQSYEKHIITEFGDNKFNLKNRTNVYYYSEMPENRISGDEYYYTKMRFDLIRPPKYHKNKLYVNAPKYGPVKGAKDKLEFLKIINEKVKSEELDGYIEKSSGTNSNVFEEFSHYMYFKTLNWPDPRPRMFHECYYFKIPITYINIYNIKDGSYLRYHELIKNGLENRHLTKDDTLIKILLY